MTSTSSRGSVEGAHRLEARVVKGRVQGRLDRAVVEGIGRLGLARAAPQASHGAGLVGIRAVERHEDGAALLPLVLRGPLRELPAEIVALEEVGREGGPGEAHEAPPLLGRSERGRVGRRVLEPRQRDERRAEGRPGRRLAQEGHRDVGDRAVSASPGRSDEA